MDQQKRIMKRLHELGIIYFDVNFDMCYNNNPLCKANTEETSCKNSDYIELQYIQEVDIK